MGRGSIGATIKDTRTKSRGGVAVGEGGGTGFGGVEGWGTRSRSSVGVSELSSCRCEVIQTQLVI